MMLLKTTIFVVFLTGCCFTPGKALDCLTCKNVTTCSESCDDLVNEENLRSAAMLLPNLKINIHEIPDPVCMTILFKVNGTDMVNQRCAHIGEELACHLVKVDSSVVNRTDLKLVDCKTCDTDNCNVDTIHEEIPMVNMFMGMFNTLSPDEQNPDIPNKTKTTPLPEHNSINNAKPKKSGSNSHYDVIISTYIMACLTLALF
ncbi:hypothetical protein B566_EDAN007731 [Ephemera danica]|nr:hypothetical protein B566_EDAN007731 [Ephemera danica]